MNLQKGKPQGTHSSQQPRGQYTNLRVPQAVQVSRQEDYIRQGPGYNPQAVPNPTGLYASPAGGVAGGPGPQQAPPPPQAVAMPGTATVHPNPQAAAPQQTGVVPGQMQQQRAPYFRPNVVRQFTNMSLNTINMPYSAPQVSASGFQAGAVPSVTYLQSPPTAYGMPQATILRGPPVNVSSYQFASTPAPGQYNIQQPQALFLSTGNTNYATYANQRPVYYGQLSQVINPMPSNRNSMPALPPQQAAQQQIPPTQKRERKPLRIQHPDTLEDIKLNNEQEFIDHPSDPSMSKEGSQMDSVTADLTDPVRIQFAKQVAAVAIPVPSRKEPHKQEGLVPNPGTPIITPILPVASCISPGILVPQTVPTDVLLEAADRVNVVMSMDPQNEVVSNDELVEELPEYELGTPVPPHEVMGGHDMHIMDSIDGLEEEEEEEEEEAYSPEECGEEAEFEAEVVVEEDDFQVEDASEAVEDVEEPVPQPVGRTCSPPPSPAAYQQAEEEVAPPSLTVLPSPMAPSMVVEVPPLVSVPPPAPVSSPPRDSPTPETEEILPEEKKQEVQMKPQQNGDLGPIPFDSKETSEGRDNKKKGKKKIRELNKKGEGKEGSEMDAFVVDRVEDVTLSNSNQIAPSLTTKVVLSSPDREAEDEEQRKVAEKNQENTRVSGQDEKSATPVIEPIQAKPQLLKYAYKEDQWSPLNPEGKKHYDRAFLLKMQSQPMSLKKPEGLPNLEVIKDIAMQFKLPEPGNRPAQAPMQAVHRGNQPDFMPSFARGGTPRPPQGANRRQSQQGREKPKKIITISSSLNEDVKLHSSENAWKPTYKAPPETETEEDAKSSDLYKKVRGILNKLTPQKFQTLVEQVKELPVDTEERLKGVIDLVFEKAVDEPNFSVPYANMCKHLAMKAVPSGQSNQNVNFRKLLLTKCQKEFESDSRDEIRRTERLQEISTADPDKRKQLMEELEEELRKSRRRSLGNIKFIGELYKLNMLVTPIMHDCLKKLLKAEDEDSLECLCRLLTTVGKELESDKKTDSAEKRAQNKALMDVYFDGMKKVVENRNTSSRVRFMIQDVIELRLNNWVPRRIENNPKTIDQIHMEAEREAHEQHLMIQQPLPPSANKRPDDRDRRKNRSMQGSGFEESGGWNTVGSKVRSSASFNYDPSKGTPKLVSKPLETETIQLGPSNRTWSRGSSGGGSRPANQESDSKTSMPTNRFQALASQDSEPRRTLHQSSSSSREPSRGRGSQGGGGPPMTLRKTPSQSNQSSSERENMTAMVKAFFNPHSADHPTPSSRNQAPEPSRDSPEPKEVVPPAASVPVVPPVAVEASTKVQSSPGEYQLTGRDLTYDEMTKGAVPIVDEYLHNNDLKEAVQCILELASPASIDLFVSVSVNHVLERSGKARIALGHLLLELLSKKILNRDQLFQGLESIFESVMDLEIDIPKVWQYLGEILFPLMQDGSLTLSQLRKASTPCIQQNCGGKMFSNLLHVMAEHLGINKVRELWEKSDLQWPDIIGPDENPEEFVTANKLEFVTTRAPAAPVEEFTMEQLKQGLDALLEKDSSNECIFDWIEAKLDRETLSHPNFIRALVTSITESSIEEGNPEKWDAKKIKDRILVLTKYIDNQEHLELQALYALQALDNRLQHPKGMLVHIFEALYDEDVISEDAFGQWEKSTDPGESEGKGVALKSVTSFFTWLKEAEDESLEEN